MVAHTVYERIAIVALVQVASIDVFERVASLLSGFFLLLSPNGTGSATNVIFFLLTWVLVLLAIWLPAVWYFSDAELSFAHGLIVGGASALLVLVIVPSETWLPFLIFAAYAIYAGVRGRRAAVSAPTPS